MLSPLDQDLGGRQANEPPADNQKRPHQYQERFATTDIIR